MSLTKRPHRALVFKPYFHKNPCYVSSLRDNHPPMIYLSQITQILFAVMPNHMLMIKSHTDFTDIISATA